MLKIDGLKVSYGGIEAVKGITFEVPERKIVTRRGQEHHAAHDSGPREAREGPHPPPG